MTSTTYSKFATADGHGGTEVSVTPTTIKWASPVDGTFENGANWIGGSSPGAGEAAYLDDPSTTAYTVTASTAQTVDALTLDAGATLEITGGTFITKATGAAITSAGAIAVSGGAALEVSGSIVNSGTLSLGGGAGAAELTVESGAVTLSGGGHLILGSNGLINAAAAGDGLTNLDNTITGGGSFSGVALSNQAFGVIDATSGMSIDTTVANAGLIESTGGDLTFYAATVNGSGSGEILADGAGADIFLYSDDIAGGTLDTENGGAIFVEDQASLLDGSASAVSNTGALDIIDENALTLKGAIQNSGVIALEGSTHYTQLLIGTGGATLSGAGTVTLGPMAVIAETAKGVSLTNFSDTIAGGGFIEGPLGLTNGAAGVIDADAGRMVLNLDGTTVTNDGVIEATGTGGLLLVRDTTLDGAGGGSIVAGKTVMLDHAAISGGALTIQAGGELLSFVGDLAHASTINLEGGTVNNAGTLAGAGGGLTVMGDVADTGVVIAVNGSLTITGGVTGSGKIEVFGKGTLEIDGAQGGTIAFGAGATGRLVLGDSAAFGGTVTGLSKTGANSIDLEDIDFADDPSATYVANKNANSGGVLTVSDGTHTATIMLKGANYGGSAKFTLSQDSGTGTIVVDPTTNHFVAAMATFGIPGPVHASTAPPSLDPPLIAAPKTSLI